MQNKVKFIIFKKISKKVLTNLVSYAKLTLSKEVRCKFLSQVIYVNLKEALEGKEYIIKSIETDDEELDAFLFSLGCYSGEPITVISHLKGGCVVSIKDGRYSIDKELAEAIII